LSTKSYTIGPTARRAQISDPTLRSWEREGLIPAPDRSSDGRRQFSELQVEFICDLARRRREENRRGLDE
jgi:DNA-binding transcriptional MerR regulator